MKLEQVKAVQVVAADTFPLAEGALYLEEIEESTLLLRIGETFAVTLKSDTIAGTTDDGAFVLVIKSDAADLTIRIDVAKETTEAELEAFERILVDAGYMLTGPQADADQLARTIGRIAGQAADSLSGFARSGLGTVRGNTRFSETTHFVSERSAEGAKALSIQAQKVSSWLGKSVQSFGSLLGESLGTRGAIDDASHAAEGTVRREAVDTAKDVAEAGQILSNGVGEGAETVGSAAAKAIDAQVRQTHGEEGVKLAQEARTTASGAGKVAGTVAMETSGTVHAGHLATGAVSSK
ncbi:hypothetical protein BCR37DRAFT_390610 [Protomyces lactucae-debilis]|uniref:Senescence domain-containing protein n=1 Tax=Protomyces lactucae-debilis TaxID=2754530 RepID=A0A1Y2FSG1_PROLT|nr:uncharacterized protein BCR37DRAFT_390610 [Protomyces lactucae-debilis]ORY86879.1 hypothetical protein BCR37DRAFT_390610 [Protomyces lactucae-debilis]